MSATQELAQAVASSDFKVGSELSITEIHDGGSRMANAGDIDPSDFVIVADVSIPFSGTVPSSARVLNALVTDWVAANLQQVDALLREPVGQYLEDNYPEIDLGAILEGNHILVWEDQVDYMVAIDPDDGNLHFTVETLLDLEQD